MLVRSLPLAGCVSARGGWVFIHPSISYLNSPGGEEDTGTVWPWGCLASLQENADYMSPVLHGPVMRMACGKALWSCWGVQGDEKGWAGIEKADKGGRKELRAQICGGVMPILNLTWLEHMFVFGVWQGP